MQPATIKLFLVNGSPESLRTAEISNWTGKAIACPRSELKAMLAREECGRTGVYFLHGMDAETNQPALYVGEAEEVGKRLRQHSDKDFWTSVIAVVSKDENLTKAHVKFLEGLLIDKAKSVRGIQLVNSQTSGAKLPESEQAEMQVFLGMIHQLLPVLGLNVFQSSDHEPVAKHTWLHCSVKGLKAQGRRTAAGFLVKKSSQSVLQDRASATYSIPLRQALIDSGVLKASGGHYLFTEDYEFSSPSYAASAIVGGHANGLTTWKNAKGVTLKDLDVDA